MTDLELMLTTLSALLALGVVFAMVDSKQNQRKARKAAESNNEVIRITSGYLQEKDKELSQARDGMKVYQEALEEIKQMLNDDREYILKLEDELEIAKIIAKNSVLITPLKKEAAKKAPAKKVAPKKKTKKA